MSLTVRPATASAGPVLVWYDGGCPLCTREIRLMRWLDRGQRIRFIDAATTNSACPVERDVLLARLHAMENGNMFTGAAAFAAMWRAIPVLRPFGLAAQLPLIARGLEAAYTRFLRLRPHLQRWLR